MAKEISRVPQTPLKRATQKARGAASALAADVGKAESHSPAPRWMAYNPGRRSHVVVNVSASDHNGSIVDLTSTGDVQATDSNEE